MGLLFDLRRRRGERMGAGWMGGSWVMWLGGCGGAVGGFGAVRRSVIGTIIPPLKEAPGIPPRAEKKNPEEGERNGAHAPSHDGS